MEKIIIPRRLGKTTQLIMRSAESGDVIVCNGCHIQTIYREAKKMGCDIPMPISYFKFINKEYEDINGLLIDDVDILLKIMCSVPINTITLSP